MEYLRENHYGEFARIKSVHVTNRGYPPIMHSLVVEYEWKIHEIHVWQQHEKHEAIAWQQTEQRGHDKCWGTPRQSRLYNHTITQDDMELPVIIGLIRETVCLIDEDAFTALDEHVPDFDRTL